jgi:hypothetical protein
MCLERSEGRTKKLRSAAVFRRFSLERLVSSNAFEEIYYYWNNGYQEA